MVLSQIGFGSPGNLFEHMNMSSRYYWVLKTFSTHINSLIVWYVHWNCFFLNMQITNARSIQGGHLWKHHVVIYLLIYQDKTYCFSYIGSIYRKQGIWTYFYNLLSFTTSHKAFARTQTCVHYKHLEVRTFSKRFEQLWIWAISINEENINIKN